MVVQFCGRNGRDPTDYCDAVCMSMGVWLIVAGCLSELKFIFTVIVKSTLSDDDTKLHIKKDEERKGIVETLYKLHVFF